MIMKTPYSLVIEAVAVAVCYSMVLCFSYLILIWMPDWSLFKPFLRSGAGFLINVFVILCIPIACFFTNQYFLRLFFDRAFVRVLLASALVVLQMSAFFGFYWWITDGGVIDLGPLQESLYNFYLMVFTAVIASFVTIVIPPLLMVVLRFRSRLL